MGEIITRRNLPHWYMPGALHFVTFRLVDSLPKSVIAELAARKEHWLREPRPAGTTLAQHRERTHKLLFAAYDEYLDRQRDKVWLEAPQISSLVRRSLYYLHAKKYRLAAYTIMPNHVHVLFQPIILDQELALTQSQQLGNCSSDTCELREDQIGETKDKSSPLASIMHSLKSFTAHEANKLLKREGQFWQHESYDHWVRDANELERIVEYMDANAPKARLACRAHEWFWCSAHDRFLTDGELTGWLRWDP